MALDTSSWPPNISFELMKGLLIILLFTGKTVLVPFEYEGIDYTGDGIVDSEEQVLSCSIGAEKQYLNLAEHSWTDPRGAGFYLKDGTGTLQGHIC